MNGASVDESKIARISIIEDSAIHREWLGEELSAKEYLQIVSMDNSGKQGLESVKLHKPDLVLLDFQLTDMTGLEISKRIKLNDDSIKIFMLTAHTDVSIIERIISDKNIDAVAIKGSPYFELNFLSAIQFILNGGTYLEPSILTKLRESNTHLGLSGLTKREFEVFIQLNTGKSDQEVADDLFVDVAHVKNIKSRILKKVKHDDLDGLLSKLLENSSSISLENDLWKA